MRPRRQILLWAEREDWAGILAFALNQQHDLRIIKAENDRQFRSLLQSRIWDLVIVPHAVSPKRTANHVAKVKTVERHTPVLILTTEKAFAAPLDTLADRVLAWGTDTAQVIEYVRMLTARKRGPKKQERDPELTAKEVA